MGDRPAAEVQITVPLVRRLLLDQCPALAHLDLAEVSEGWDNVMLRLGADLAVRVPRRQLAAQLVVNEQHWLPTLAASLATVVDVAVPAPVHRGHPSDYFPWAWSVVPWFEGTEVGALPIAHRAPLAIDLARCVRALHRPAPPEAPANPYRGVPLAHRAADIDARLCDPAVPRADEARRVWADALAAPVHEGPAVWLHGDLHPFNMLARPGVAPPSTQPSTRPSGSSQASTPATLCALIDFGDLTSGDPACDLATAWLTFDAAGRRAFRAEVERLGAVDAATWRRARGWALVMASAMLTHSDDDPRFAILGARALTEILDDA
ncbi:aminoglycoside phosphotransferase family protein [Sanguibacter suarezii]|uniref:aminoglycoside phosphotransferase family protein n=1 Tax=Sanguibacter suarezii TaxID=60921 RepID=UPI00083355A3|nr:aminoglycoside phosphotransferase family protein [Sanguibacter suarezii]